MDLAKAKRLVKRINDRDGDGTARLYLGYSGRFMFGAETTGVVLPHWAIPKNWRGARDSMGLDAIIY